MRASSNPFSEIPSSERVAASNEGPTSSRRERARSDRNKLRRFAWSMKSIKRITFFCSSERAAVVDGSDVEDTSETRLSTYPDITAPSTALSGDPL